jgi:uncharacterized protein
MTATRVLFIQGGGEGAHNEDAPLADSLRNELGPGHDVLFPQMPNEADPNVEAWKQKISSELSRAPGKVVLVAHSVGGSILLRYLSEEGTQAPVAGVFVLAAPSWDQDRWDFEDLKLPRDIAEKLAPIPWVSFYHCRDDEVVPFKHLALHSARLPRAAAQAFDIGGHQFSSDLASVAADIRRCAAAQPLAQPDPLRQTP